MDTVNKVTLWARLKCGLRAKASELYAALKIAGNKWTNE